MNRNPGRRCRKRSQASTPGDRDAAIEKFIAAKGGRPIIENLTMLVFLAKDKDGQTTRIVGDFNAWAVIPQGYDVSIGETTRIEGSSWSYLEGTSYNNARLEYGFSSTRSTPRTPPIRERFKHSPARGPKCRMPFFVAQPRLTHWDRHPGAS